MTKKLTPGNGGFMSCQSNIPPAIIVRDVIQFAAPSPTGRTRGDLPAGAASLQGMA